ncbi:MAG: DUF1217 domain-containing protein [Acetobacteraceae bacterium]|nr:DUF1217 domain-containing protein [Acetobacteraceae bacterium]
MIANAALLSLFGGVDASSSLGPSGRIALYKTSVDNAARDTARLEADPKVKRDLARLDRALARARTPADLFRDPEAVRVILQGLGLADQAGNPGLARQALLSDPSKADSVANLMPDTRWKAAAKQLAFAKTGLDTINSAAMRETIASGLVEYARVTAIQQRSIAVSDALVVRNLPAGKAPGVYDVLGNGVLRRFVQTIAGLPPEIAVQGVEAQARQVQRAVRLEDLADPAKREKMIQRYLMAAQDNAAESNDLVSLALRL